LLSERRNAAFPESYPVLRKTVSGFADAMASPSPTKRGAEKRWTSRQVGNVQTGR